MINTVKQSVYEIFVIIRNIQLERLELKDI